MLVPLVPENAIPQPATDEPPPVRQSAGSLLLSLAFWTTLTAAAALLAAAQLAPALVRWNDAQQLKHRHALELTHLEAQLSRLERLAHTLETDPQFATTVRSGHYSLDSAGQLVESFPASLKESSADLLPEQTAAVADTASPSSADAAFPSPANSVTPVNSGNSVESPLGLPPLPPFQQILHQTLLPAARQLTANPPLLRQLLWIAAGLTLFAFTCLNTTAAATTLTILKLPLTTATTLHHRYAPRNHHFPTNPPEPVAVPSVPGIIPAHPRSDSSVGRATDS